MSDMNNTYKENNNATAEENARLSADLATRITHDEISCHSAADLDSPGAQLILSEILEELRKELKSILDKCGIYYQLNARVKSVQSLNKKLSTLDENRNFLYKKGSNLIQDLFGYRILIYFVEDLPILKRLMNKHFGTAIRWTNPSHSIQEFKAISTNGVFALNESLAGKLEDVIGDILIDKTFEIQLRTVTFDGWLEVEHDYNYKYINMWKDQREYLRRFSSILATLELCDDTMVNTLENLSYDIYAQKRHPARYINDEYSTGEYINDNKKGFLICDWDRLIRAHFRLRIRHVSDSATPDQELTDELYNLFDSEKISDKQEAYKFAKYVLRFRKETLIELFYDPRGTLDLARKNAKKNAENSAENGAENGAKNGVENGAENDARNGAENGAENSAEINPENKDSGQFHNGKMIWEDYHFMDMIPVNVNSIVVLILLYKEAKEASLSSEQRLMLSRPEIAGYVADNISGKDLRRILNEETGLLSLPVKLELSNGWNTVHQNNLIIATAYNDPTWKDEFTDIIISDMLSLFTNIYAVPDNNVIIDALSREGHYEYTAAEKKECSFTIQYKDDGIIYAIEYPGIYKADNLWRQFIEFTADNTSKVIGAKGIMLRMKLCIQYYNSSDGEEYSLPVINEPEIFKKIRSHSKNTAYPVKPYIGQKKPFKEQKHYLDITYVKQVRNADNTSLMLTFSEYFINAVSRAIKLHPIILFLFDSMDELYKMETAIALFENSIGNLAYVYAGIITDEEDPVFQKYYADDDADFIPFGNDLISKSGVYVFRSTIAGIEGMESTAILTMPFDTIGQCEYIPGGTSYDEAAAFHGIYAVLEMLRNDLRKYNLIVQDEDINSMVESIHFHF